MSFLILCMPFNIYSDMFLCSWNEWLTLPVQYSDLPRSSQLCLTVWEIYGTDNVKPVGGTTIALFSKRGYEIKDSKMQMKFDRTAQQQLKSGT